MPHTINAPSIEAAAMADMLIGNARQKIKGKRSSGVMILATVVECAGKALLLSTPTALFNPFPLTPTLSPRRGRIVVLFGTIRSVLIFRRAGKWLSLSLGRGLG